VVDFDQRLAASGLQDVVVTLAQNLELENQALLRGDESLLSAVDHGDRLAEMEARLSEATASGRIPVVHYQFDRIDASLLVPFGRQTGLSIGLRSTGTMTEETHDADGKLVESHTSPFDLIFAVRQVTGARWLNVAALPANG
jgi:hypothetical protein